MADITVVAAKVRPLVGTTNIRAIADEALAFGDSVYVSTYSGDLPVVSKTDGNGALGVTLSIGIVVGGGRDGVSTVADGDPCDICIAGPVTGWTDLTTGTNIWVSDNAGLIANAVSGTHSCVVGVALSPTVLLVRPGAYVVST